jgi:hypothetical protein
LKREANAHRAIEIRLLLRLFAVALNGGVAIRALRL